MKKCEAYTKKGTMCQRNVGKGKKRYCKYHSLKKNRIGVKYINGFDNGIIVNTSKTIRKGVMDNIVKLEGYPAKKMEYTIKDYGDNCYDHIYVFNSKKFNEEQLELGELPLNFYMNIFKT